MPTYDYECGHCGKPFELFQSIHDAPVKKCPACGRQRARRLIGAGAGLIFKGSGFYITDYKKSSSCGEKSGAETPSATTSSTPAKPDGKTDKKT